MPRPSKKLPPGFELLDSGSIRVRIRITGHETVSEVFPLFGTSAEDKQLQMTDAQAWASVKRRELLGGTHTSTKEAARTTLGEALQRYMDKDLRGKPSNVQKDRNRIKQILGDPIAKRSVGSLTDKDLAKYRDELISRSTKERGSAPARTTITNKLQLITRALNVLRERIDGVPRLSVKAPVSSPGRERRPSASEMEALLLQAEKINALLPLMIKFATLTALRLERILEVSLSHIQALGKGARAIMFPRSTSVRNKKTGVIPVTREIQSVIDDVLQINGDSINITGAPLFSINGNTFDHQWRRAVKAAQIDDLHFHDLRHEATSRLFERGLNMIEVMSITGHSTAEMIDRYSHYSSILVLKKLDSGLKAEEVASEFKFLLAAFQQQGGDVRALRMALSDAMTELGT